MPPAIPSFADNNNLCHYMEVTNGNSNHLTELFHPSCGNNIKHLDSAVSGLKNIEKWKAIIGFDTL